MKTQVLFWLVGAILITVTNASSSQQLGYDPTWAATAGADTPPEAMMVPAASQCDAWASPSGSGSSCTSQMPCTLPRCMQQLGGSTQAQVCCLQAGTYTVSSTLRPDGSGSPRALP